MAMRRNTRYSRATLGTGAGGASAGAEELPAIADLIALETPVERLQRDADLAALVPHRDDPDRLAADHREPLPRDRHVGRRAGDQAQRVAGGAALLGLDGARLDDRRRRRAHAAQGHGVDQE